MTGDLTREDVVELQRLVNEERRRIQDRDSRAFGQVTGPAVYRLELLSQKLARLPCP